MRKEVPASAEAYFFKSEVNDHIIDTELGRIGVMICYENYLARIANKVAAAEVDLLLSPFSFPELPGGTGPQPLAGSEYAGFYGAALGVPVAAVNKVGKWHSPVPGYPGYITDGEFPGLSAISLANGEIAAQADRSAGFVMARVHLDPAVKKTNTRFPGTYIEGLIGDAPSTAEPGTEADEEAVYDYMRNEQRRTKATTISGAKGE